jgi:ATP-dependent exoDNAse (exonuclease V) beta subunit
MNASHLPPDFAQRRQALSPRESFHVESPAGAGKTSLLTARYIHLLALVNHPHEILALTFTNKAANEMVERIRGLLDQAEAGESSPSPWLEALLPVARQALQKHDRHRYLFQTPEGLQVMTFHKFCAQLIRRAPAEAGVPLEATPLSEEEQPELIQRAIEKTCRSLSALPASDPNRQGLERYLLAMNNRWDLLAGDLAQLVAQRDQLLDLVAEVTRYRNLDHLDQVLKDHLGKLVSFYLDDLRRRFSATDLGRNWQDFHTALRDQGAGAADTLPPALPDTAWQDLPRWQALSRTFLTKSGTVRKSLGPKSGFPQGFNRGPWAERIARIPGAVEQRLDQIAGFPLPDSSPGDSALLFDLILLISQVIDRYRQLCHQRGVIDFVEMEQGALRILGNEESPSDMQLLLDQKINHILVDEFQDTSFNQWRLLQLLCAGWSPGDGRTLFIVGDPKQSIYGFRKAEVSLFIRAREGLPLPGQGHLPLTPIAIETNFRSRPRLIDFVNGLFSETIMADPRPEADEVLFRKAAPAPEMAGREPGRIHLALFNDRGNNFQARQKEAAWLAGAVAQTIHGEPKLSLAILLFARTHLPIYLQALYARGLQVQVQEGLLLLERPEVNDLLALTRALIRPQDDLSWLSLLRSHWCWVDLNFLYRISRVPATLFSEKIKLFAGNPGVPESLQRVGSILESYQDLAGRWPVSRLIQRAWEDLQGPGKAAARYGLAGVRNCRQFLDYLFQAEGELPEECLERLDLLLRTAYAPPDPLADRSSVQLMTVHRAKGLEFDAVFIPHLDRNPLERGNYDNPPYLLERLPGNRDQHLIALRPDRRTKEDPETYALLKKLRKARALGEAKRLYYVAMTRARSALLLSGLVSEKDNGLKTEKDSLLAYLLNHPGLEEQVEHHYNPEPPAETFTPAQPSLEKDSEAMPFQAEPVPYQVIRPSRLADKAAPVQDWERKEPLDETYRDPAARARGIVIHRILQHLTQGGTLPAPAGVAEALRAEGMDPANAGEQFAGLLDEIAACQKEVFGSFILGTDFPFAASEWKLEDCLDDQILRSGVIDRIVFDGRQWFLVDYKTGKPAEGTTVEDFLEQQTALYREQLLAYKEMLVKAKSLEPNRIRLFLYFTALQQSREIT